jgi:hypothetical protein
MILKHLRPDYYTGLSENYTEPRINVKHHKAVEYRKLQRQNKWRT